MVAELLLIKMSISYPITLPATPGFTNVRVQPKSVVGVFSSPFTMQQQVYAHPGQLWTAEFELPAMSRVEAAPWVAALTSLNGSEGTFLFGDPAWSTPQGIGTGTPLVNGGSQTEYDLITDGWTASQTGIVKAGDWLQIGAGSTVHLHMVMADANSDGSGNATITIWPRLRNSPTDNTALSVSSALGLWRLSGNTPWSININQLISGLTVQCVEAI